MMCWAVACSHAQGIGMCDGLRDIGFGALDRSLDVTGLGHLRGQG